MILMALNKLSKLSKARGAQNTIWTKAAYVSTLLFDVQNCVTIQHRLDFWSTAMPLATKFATELQPACVEMHAVVRVAVGIKHFRFFLFHANQTKIWWCYLPR